ncbi:MAG: ATP-binding protein [Actinomycetota bacterium]
MHSLDNERAKVAVNAETQGRKAHQEALEASEALFKALLNSAPDAAIIVDGEGRMVLVNEQAERVFGYPRAQLVGQPVEILLPDRFRNAHMGHRKGYIADPKTRPMGAGLELAGLRKNGEEFPVDISLSAITTEDETLAMAFIRDITDRKRAERELEAARDQALEASRLKSQFLANMSHEIRTPMNGILGMAQLLLGSPLDATQSRQLMTLRESSLSLLALLNDILDFSKVEAGRLELESHDFDLLASVDGVAGLLAASAADKGLELIVDIGPDVSGWVTGDPLRLRQVLINVVGNAIKFTEGGSVRLAVRKVEGDRLRFEIQDTGIGIHPSDRARLMLPFSQADASTTRRFGGTGLGLAISTELIRKMGGSLDFTSEPGVGTTFWFEVDLPAADKVPTDSVGIDAGIRSGGPAWPEIMPEVLRAGARVLLVDDARLNLEVGTGLLSAAGYQVDGASNGMEALEAVQRTSYDAVLMDCLMPEMDGYEATRRIRQLKGPVAKTPIIAVTAAAMNEDRGRCLAAGMDDYVAKPLEAEVLLTTLARWVPEAVSGSADRSEIRAPDRDGKQILGEQYDQLVRSLPAEVIRRVSEEFVSETPGLVADLSAAVRAGERTDAKKLAHKLKGSAATMGAVGLSSLAEKIEAGQDRSADDPGPLLDELEREYERVADALGLPIS